MTEAMEAVAEAAAEAATWPQEQGHQRPFRAEFSSAKAAFKNYNNSSKIVFQTSLDKNKQVLNYSRSKIGFLEPLKQPVKSCLVNNPYINRKLQLHRKVSSCPIYYLYIEYCTPSFQFSLLKLN